MLDVSCFYVNYNSAAFTVPAIKSLVKYTTEKVSYEIVVVDNASNYEDFLLLTKGLEELNLSNLKIYRSKINAGFGGGNMLGVNIAFSSQYFAFINNDTLFTQENTLLDLKMFMDSTPDAGMCGPQMMSENGTRISSLDHCATPMRQLLKRDIMEAINPVKYPKRKNIYAEPVSCGYVPGSFMFVNAASFNEVGGFDTALFLYYEESDLCRRMEKKLGKKTYHYPHQSYIHYQGKSTQRSVVIKLEQKLSLLYLTLKHHGRLYHALLLFYYTLKYGLSALFSKNKRFLFRKLLQGGSINQSLRTKQVILER
jgi:hypothetical protein